MLVKELMTSGVVTVEPGSSAALAARLLSRHNVGALPVCSREGRLRGMVTDRDIITRCVAAGEDASRVPVCDIMSSSLVTIAPEDDVRTAARQMAVHQVRRLPVVRNGQVVGMLSLGDLAQNRRCDTEAAAALGDISCAIRRRKR